MTDLGTQKILFTQLIDEQQMAEGKLIVGQYFHVHIFTIVRITFSTTINIKKGVVYQIHFFVKAFSLHS